MRFLDLIAKKRDGAAHTAEEIAHIVAAAASGSVPDYQLSAWLMAVTCRGMDKAETIALTRAMAGSGEALDFRSVRRPKADKHSTGGVGDGVSLALAPLLAEAGLAVPMMSGRGLGHTGGTLDKLESIAGLRVRLTLDEIRRQISSIGVAMFGQTDKLAPADRKLYQLRDVTGTVPSLPLIVGSILSKKLAEGLDALILDIKVGTGAIFKTQAEAEQLARALVVTSKGLGLPAVGVLTAMDEPLGRAVGNALEMRQSIEVLQGDLRARDFVDCLLALGAWSLKLCGKARTPQEGERKLEAILKSGAAAHRLKRMIEAQGGEPDVVDDPAKLPRAEASVTLAAPRAGYVARLDARKFGEAAVMLGAGRATVDDVIDYGAGLLIEKKVGEKVAAGEPVARLFSSDPSRLDGALARLREGLTVTPKAPKLKPVVRKIIR